MDDNNRHEAGPIFLIGAARSGTTMVQYMLRSHPDIYLPTAESHFIVPFYHRISQYGELSNKHNLRSLLDDIYRTRKRFFDEDMNSVSFNSDTMAELLAREQRTTFPQIVSGIFEANARAENKKRWGDKTPYYILHLPTILEMFPDARIIHLIRDGRDCCLSMLKRKHDLRIFNTYHAACLWKKYVDAGQKFGQLHPNLYYEVHYEKILDDPNNTMSQLLEFLGEDIHDPSGHFSQPDSDSENTIRTGRKTPLVGKPIKQNNQKKWRTEMSSRQIMIFEAVAGDTLKRNGYQLVNEAPAISGINKAGNELYIRLNHLRHKYRNRLKAN